MFPVRYMKKTETAISVTAACTGDRAGQRDAGGGDEQADHEHQLAASTALPVRRKIASETKPPPARPTKPSSQGMVLTKLMLCRLRCCALVR